VPLNVRTTTLGCFGAAGSGSGAAATAVVGINPLLTSCATMRFESRVMLDELVSSFFTRCPLALRTSVLAIQRLSVRRTRVRTSTLAFSLAACFAYPLVFLTTALTCLSGTSFTSAVRRPF
jgi:hypothetical protein